jgi:hypothetical protein
MRCSIVPGLDPAPPQPTTKILQIPRWIATGDVVTQYAGLLGVAEIQKNIQKSEKYLGKKFRDFLFDYENYSYLRGVNTNKCASVYKLRRIRARRMFIS